MCSTMQSFCFKRVAIKAHVFSVSSNSPCRFRSDKKTAEYYINFINVCFIYIYFILFFLKWFSEREIQTALLDDYIR